MQTNKKPYSEQQIESVPDEEKKIRINRSRIIQITSSRNIYHVYIEDFIKVSNLIKQQQEDGNVMSSISLNNFDNKTVISFVKYSAFHNDRFTPKISEISRGVSCNNNPS
ncbi:unnamed protein product [Caenorhabditis angaria]|uniref:Uncharacterized protein n=1 Tax=Caenorhabditis angaria TaxID=860376 RepID=A0A9P1N820_9PELO|nr:unnamed protein product [Caenorhabditis angaria]